MVVKTMLDVGVLETVGVENAKVSEDEVAAVEVEEEELEDIANGGRKGR